MNISYDHEIKDVFFDIDGVLSAMAYYDEKSDDMVIGFSDEDWNRYCENEGVYAYRYCSPVPFIKDFIAQLKEDGCTLYVLSTVASQMEMQAKILFLDKHYPDTFKDYCFVRHDDDKVKLIEEIAEKDGIELRRCMMVDDTYSILLKTHLKGICSVHISNLLADNVSR